MRDYENVREQLLFYAQNAVDDDVTKDLTDAAVAIEELLATVPHWISVEERLPECGSRCMVLRFDYVTNTPFVDLLWFDGEWWNRIHHGKYAVTHWMPLPEPPKEELNKNVE